MDSRIGDVVEEWRPRACDPGYAGLHQLADDGFSGAVTAGGARGFMVNGRMIGIDGGTIESFWGSEFVAAQAEDPAVPLLCGMWLSDQEVEAEYYTGETSIAEVDTTLTQGNFTGFVELSENVFSGDYYLVYYGGTSFSVAFIGTDERLVTGDEAFERADEEVGIYEVKSVDIDVIDIPDPDVDDSRQAAAQDDGADAPADAGTDASEPISEPEPEPEPGSGAGADASPQVEIDDAEPEASADRAGADTAADDGGEASAEAETAEAAAGEQTEPPGTEEPSQNGSARADAGASDARQGESDLASLAAAAEGTEADEEGAPMTIDDASAVDGEIELLPSLDPQRTTRPPGHDADDDAEDRTSTPASTPLDPGSRSGDGRSQPSQAQDVAARAADERVEQLEAELAEAKEAREDLAAENERLTERIAQLEAEIEELEAELAEATADAGADGLSPAAAIGGTNLFVRYESKADFTLDDGIDGGGDPAEIDRNLQLEWHTEFDAEDVTIDDEPFETFLQGTTHYRFASWLVTELLFELRDTGGDKGLADLYEAIPDIDRIEFDGEVPIQTSDGGDRGSSVYAFDVVCRNSMGDPLVVADLNASREPVDGDAVSALVTNAHDVASARPSVVAAAYVTNSFYEPDALETVNGATESGFLRGGSKDSYVRVTRKRGFHLCLVESRDDSFHLTVPEL